MPRSRFPPSSPTFSLPFSAHALLPVLLTSGLATKPNVFFTAKTAQRRRPQLQRSVNKLGTVVGDMTRLEAMKGKSAKLVSDTQYFALPSLSCFENIFRKQRKWETPNAIKCKPTVPLI